MSIYYKNNQAHWYYDKNEICCKIPVAQLSKLLDNEIAFDPRSIICAFKNGEELDREALEKLRGCDKSSSIFSSLRNWMTGLSKDSVGAYILVIKAGEIKFNPYVVDGIMTKDYASVKCALTVSAKINNLEKFIMNSLVEFNQPKNAISQTALIAREEDNSRLEQIKKELALKKELRSQFTGKTNFLINISGESREAKTRLDDCNKDIAKLEAEISEIKSRAEKTYLREIRDLEQKGIDYYVFYSKDLYLSLLGHKVEGLLRKTVFDFTEDELLTNEDIAITLEERIMSIPQIVSRFEDAGLTVKIDSARILDLQKGAMSEEILQVRKEIEDTKWRVRVSEGGFDLMTRERELEKAYGRLNSDKVLDKSAEENYFNKGKGNLEAEAAADSLEIRTKKSQTEVDSKQLEAENSFRFNAIENLQSRMQLKDDFDTKWFVEELKRQDIIKANEFEKLQTSMGWEREDAETERVLKKKDVVRQEAMREWDFENAKLKNAQFSQALQIALSFDAAKAREALKDVELDAARDRRLKDEDKEIALKRKNDDYYFNRESRWDDYNFSKELRKSNFELDKDERKRNFDFEDKLRTENLADDREERKVNLDERVAENAFRRETILKRDDREHQRAMFESLKSADHSRREDERLARKDELMADVEINRLRADAEIARASGSDYREKVEAEARAKALEMMMNRYDRDREIARHDALEERDYKRRMDERNFDYEAKTRHKELDYMHDEKLAQMKSDSQNSQYDLERERMDKTYGHVERMAEINSDAKVANARCEEKEISIGRISNSSQPSQNTTTKMYCEKCNHYYQPEFVLCPLCGNKLKGVII